MYSCLFLIHLPHLRAYCTLYLFKLFPCMHLLRPRDPSSLTPTHAPGELRPCLYKQMATPPMCASGLCQNREIAQRWRPRLLIQKLLPEGGVGVRGWGDVQ